jgi:glycosyltransferase involved in cell wall biosynthesis
METENPKVSIVIATYNCSKYIEEAIFSVINQNYENIEIIVVDDASDDNTEDRIFRLLKNYPIRYIKNEKNKGPGAARNIGIKASEGEFISFLDADDLYLRKSIKKRIELFKINKNVGLVFSDYYLQKTSNQSCSFPHLKNLANFSSLLPDKITNIQNAVFHSGMYQLLIPDGFIHTSTCLIKRRALEMVGLFRTDIRNFEDLDLWFRVIMKYQSGYINEPLSIYKKYRGSLASPTSKYFRGQILFLKEVLKYSSIRDTDRKTVENDLIKYLSFYSFKLFHEKKYKKSHKTFRKLIKNRITIKNILMTAITLLPADLIDFLKEIKKVFFRFYPKIL